MCASEFPAGCSHEALVVECDSSSAKEADVVMASDVQPCSANAADAGIASDAQPCSVNVACLDEASFKNFAPLLSACQSYAMQSGCRFLREDFYADDGLSGTAWQGTLTRGVRNACDGNLISQKSDDTSTTVAAMAERLRAQDSAMVEEIERAYHLVMVESVRNAMIGTFHELNMWPPMQKPRVDDDDCSYEDVSSALPVIAQRAYNDEMRRRTSLIGVGGLCLLRRRATTASFLIDFAQAVGIELPALPQTHAMMLTEFSCRVQEWELKHSRPCKKKSRDAFMCGLGNGVVADNVRSRSSSFWQPAPSPLFVASAILMGPVVRASLAVTAEALQRQTATRRQHV